MQQWHVLPTAANPEDQSHLNDQIHKVSVLTVGFFVNTECTNRQWKDQAIYSLEPKLYHLPKLALVSPVDALLKVVN